MTYVDVVTRCSRVFGRVLFAVCSSTCSQLFNRESSSGASSWQTAVEMEMLL
jgi:hypothetical protein